jgi:hypothetical protein
VKLRKLIIEINTWNNLEYKGSLEIADRDGQLVTIQLSTKNARAVADAVCYKLPSCVNAGYDCDLYPEVLEAPEVPNGQEG